MQGEFEKRIKKKMQQFHLTPSKQVWDDISAALNNQKRRRFFGWWWAPAASVLLMAGGGWFIYNSQTIKDIRKTNAVVVAKNNKAKETIEDVTALTVKKNHTTLPERVYNLTRHNNNFSEQFLAKQERLLQKEVAKILPAETPAATAAPALQNSLPTTADIIQQPGNLISNPAINTNENAAANNNFLKPGDNKTYTAAAFPRLAKNNKEASHFSMILAAGSTNITDKNVLQKKKNDLIYYPHPTVGNPNPTPDTLKYLRKSYSGYHFSAGIQYTKKLDKHWSFYSGLQYSFLSNRQKMGAKNIRTISISRTLDTSFSVNKSYVKIPYHYNDGTSITVRNYAHWVELPISFGYTINPAAKNKIELRTGVTAAYMFSYKWLIADGRYSKFYYAGSLTTERIFNWHGDANVTLPNNVTIGLQMKHSLTSLAKKPVQPSLYWSNFSMYTTIPLH